MQRSPGRAQCSSRSTVTVRSLTWSKSVIASSTRSGRETGDVFQPGAEFGKPVRLDGVEAALGNEIGALPVIGAIDHHKKLAALDPADQIHRIALLHRQAQPQHVEGRAQILQLQAGLVAQGGMAAVGGDGETGLDLRYGRPARWRSRRRCARPGPANPWPRSPSEDGNWENALASPARKSRKSHCGIRAMNLQTVGRRREIADGEMLGRRSPDWRCGCGCGAA